MVVFGGCTGSGYLNDIWLLDFASMRWEELNPNLPAPSIDSTSVMPSARARHSMCALGNQLYIFGGTLYNPIPLTLPRP